MLLIQFRTINCICLINFNADVCNTIAIILITLGWKISVEQQLSDMQINKIKGLNENTSAVYENIRSTATNLYDQYLGDKREQKIDINPTLVHKLYFKIKNVSETPSELWFDDIQMALFEKLKVTKSGLFNLLLEIV